MKSKLKIWIAFKPISEAFQIIRKRACWGQCLKCEKPWQATGTKFLNMTIVIIGGRQDVRYLCDDCTKKILDEKQDQTQSKNDQRSDLRNQNPGAPRS